MHACNLSYSKGRGRKILSLRSAQAKGRDTKKRAGVWLKSAYLTYLGSWVESPASKRI
jgi:hypothetical protein